MHKLFLAAVVVVVLSCTCQANAQLAAINIYIDADYSHNSESSLSIERGLRVALDSVGNQLLGRKVNLVRKDHRGNSARSLRHLKHYLADPNALFIVSGIHSPPLLAHRDYINENGILVLVPWAAAGPITRYESSVNSIFRLSIDDTKAGQVLASFAVKEKGYKRPYLMLERTGWGRSNEKTIRRALAELGVTRVQVGWFDWNLKQAGARAMVDDALAAQSDSVILVSNAIEGSVLAKSLANRPGSLRLPVVSHWGITGGKFHENIPHDQRQAIDLHFIQTRFSFVNRELDSFETGVLEDAKRLFPNLEYPQDIQAPTGFIHAHDLGLLVIEAAKRLEPDRSVEQSRAQLRSALENIDGPVRGLVKTYEKPFRPFSSDNPDAHEALNENDFVMAFYGLNNEIVLHQNAGE